MSQVDTAGTIPAIRRAFGWVVTVAVNSFVFKQPVFVGDLVSFYADILKIGRTSITVSVEVYAQRGAREGGNEVCIKVTEAVLTYVTVDNQHIPSGSIIRILFLPMLIPTVIGRILALLTILIVIFVRVEAYHANNLNASWYFSTVTRKISSGNSGARAFLFQACFSSQSRTNCLSKLDGFCPALY